MPLPCARVVTSLLIAGLTLAIACAHVPQRFPLPQEYVEIAEVPGIPRARLWGDAPPPWKHDWAGQSRAEMKVRYPGVYGHRHSYLAISGGGENGAFAAGLLLGWTAAGDRPEFTTVTGISAGALIAPFAFLGPEYDDVLRKVSVELRAKDIYKKRGKIKGLRTDAMATTEPLQGLITKYIDEEAMEKIAAEHRKGRALNIGTANLDSMRPVIWRIGVIANSGRPDALRLIRQILLASASVPGAFPPCFFRSKQAARSTTSCTSMAAQARKCSSTPSASTTTKSSTGSRCPAAPMSTSSATHVSIRCTSQSRTGSSPFWVARSTHSFGPKASATFTGSTSKRAATV
jgi:hypothetical protein